MSGEPEGLRADRRAVPGCERPQGPHGDGVGADGQGPGSTVSWWAHRWRLWCRFPVDDDDHRTCNQHHEAVVDNDIGARRDHVVDDAFHDIVDDATLYNRLIAVDDGVGFGGAGFGSVLDAACQRLRR